MSSILGLGESWIQHADRGLPLPDVVIELQAPIAELKSRQSLTPERYERPVYQESAARTFAVFRHLHNWTVVDSGDQSVTDVHRAIYKHITPILKQERSRYLGVI